MEEGERFGQPDSLPILLAWSEDQMQAATYSVPQPLAHPEVEAEEPGSL